ncbi:hypothetical protein BC830DRAFT_100543 [Chytriomyces sp. MP71]|nr:hypothetical protein BC830DRAFT_100543 [Chytriomyces sp. MP71]
MDESSESDPTDYTYFGYIEDVTDAQLVIEGCVRKTLKKFSSTFDTSTLVITSGVVVVILETGVRWRDKLTWSPSRAYGPFLLYRQVEAAEKSAQPLVNAKFRGLTRSTGIDSGIAPTFSTKTLKPGTRVVANGFTKRTITLLGSNGMRYRLISYAKADDIRKIRLNAIDGSEEYRTLSNELLQDGEVPGLTRPSHDDMFREFPGFPFAAEKKVKDILKRQSCSDSEEEPHRLRVKKTKWHKKEVSPIHLDIFEPKLDVSQLPHDQTVSSNENAASFSLTSTDASSSSSQVPRTSANPSHTSNTSCVPAAQPPALMHIMPAPSMTNPFPVAASHTPLYSLPAASHGMHPGYVFPNFATPPIFPPPQHVQVVMYPHVGQPQPFAMYPPLYQPPARTSAHQTFNYSGQTSHLNLTEHLPPITSSLPAYPRPPYQASHGSMLIGMPPIQYYGYQPPPPPAHWQSVYTAYPYPQYPSQTESDPMFLYNTAYRPASFCNTPE